MQDHLPEAGIPCPSPGRRGLGTGWPPRLPAGLTSAVDLRVSTRIRGRGRPRRTEGADSHHRPFEIGIGRTDAEAGHRAGPGTRRGPGPRRCISRTGRSLGVAGRVAHSPGAREKREPRPGGCSLRQDARRRSRGQERWPRAVLGQVEPRRPAQGRLREVAIAARKLALDFSKIARALYRKYVGQVHTEVATSKNRSISSGGNSAWRNMVRTLSSRRVSLLGILAIHCWHDPSCA